MKRIVGVLVLVFVVVPVVFVVDQAVRTLGTLDHGGRATSRDDGDGG